MQVLTYQISRKSDQNCGHRFSDQYGGRDVINYDNEFKREQLHLQTLGHCVCKFSFL